MTKAEIEKKARRLERAINWALGCRGEFRTRRDGEGAFWWRTELQKRSGPRWDAKKLRFV